MKETISNRVYEFRAKAGYTQVELAEKLGVSRQTVIAIEKGNYTPSVLLALRIAKCFSAKGGLASGGKRAVCIEDIFYER